MSDLPTIFDCVRAIPAKHNDAVAGGIEREEVVSSDAGEIGRVGNPLGAVHRAGHWLARTEPFVIRPLQ